MATPTSSAFLRPLAGGGDRRILVAVGTPQRSFLSFPRRHAPRLVARAAKRDSNSAGRPNPRESAPARSPVAAAEDGLEEVEEEIPWIQDKALDLVEFTGTVTQAIPGPRVGESPVPWLLAVPLAYVGITFVVAVVKTVRRLTSPTAVKKRQVEKNVFLLKSIDELFQKGNEAVSFSALKTLMQKTGFSMNEILRKYIRYTLNEKPFNPRVVSDLILIRKASALNDADVAGVLNDVSQRIVKEKGPVIMDLSGFTQRGFKRKLAVQALFGKILFLSELPDFCSHDNSLVIKEIFGVTDDDADSLRIHTLPEVDDIQSVETMYDESDDLSDVDTEDGSGLSRGV